MTKTPSPSEMTAEDWFARLYQDVTDAVIANMHEGRLESARNAASDAYLAAMSHARGDESAVWAYLYDWAGDETHALIEQEGQEVPQN